MLKVVRDPCGYLGDPLEAFIDSLSSVSSDIPDSILVVNDISVQAHQKLISQYKGKLPIVRLECQEPTRYIWNPENTSVWTSDIVNELSEYDAVLTHDHPSYFWRIAKWPHLFPHDQFTFLPSGFEQFTKCASIPKLSSRYYDLCYCGNLTRIAQQGNAFDVFFDQLDKRNSAVVSFEPYKNFVTHPSLSNADKFSVLLNSKITLCHNSSYVADGKIGRLSRILYSWFENELSGHPSFSNFIRHDLAKYQQITDKIERQKFTTFIPQFRYRMFEAAFSGSLMLILDDSGFADLFFDRNVQYVPFNSENIDSIIDDIQCNPYRYQQIADSALDRAINNYTSQKFLERLQRLLGFL